MSSMAGTQGEADWVLDVLKFWFEETSAGEWFAGGKDLDGKVAARFKQLHERLAARLEKPRMDSAAAILATVLVLDQFSRHLFRGRPGAYAFDALAREYTRHAVASGLDDALSPAQRMFLYLPLEHSEDRQDQVESVRLFAALGGEGLMHAIAHRDVIERFGRFPHRNRVLGRESTPAEVEALAAGMAW
jgi:uncharacterized protein (DUF924 family)